MTQSSIEILNNTIQSHNPFNKPAIVTEQDVWGKGFPDLPTLNSHASDAVFEAIREVSKGIYPVTSIAINAESGAGKSHIIGRIRHRLQDEGGALFVYMRRYGDLNLIKYQFQQVLAESLKQIGSQGVMQWQELATSMFNQISKSKRTATELVQQFPVALAKNKNLIDKLTTAVLGIKHNVNDPYIVRAILWTLSKVHAPFAINWLSGKDLADSNAHELGLPNSSKDIKFREAEALNNAVQVINLVSDYCPLIICFDELEGVEINDAGFLKIHVAAQLIKDIFDNLCDSSLSKGVVLLTMLLPTMWENNIKSLDSMGASGITARVSARYPEPLNLKFLDSNSIIDLTSLWLKGFYESKDLVPPHPVYPFDEQKLKQLGKQSPTVRSLLNWCRDNFKIEATPPIDLVDSAFQKELSEDFSNYLDDSNFLAGAIFFGIQRLIGQTIEQVTIEDVTDQVKPKSANAGYIQLKIIGKEEGNTVKIGVGVCHYPTSGRAVGASVGRLSQYQTFDLTRGCFIRSKDRKVMPNWDGFKLLEQLTQQLGGEWVDLKEDEIKPLVAIKSVYDKRENYSLSDEQIFAFIAETKLASDNALIKEILSAPSGQISDGVGEEETFQEPLTDILDETDEEPIEKLFE
jgi:hypothetical protein